MKKSYDVCRYLQAISIIVLGILVLSTVRIENGMATEDKYGGDLKIGIPKEPMSIDARYAGASVTDMWGHQHLYDRLGQWPEKVMTRTIPNLAVKWEQLDKLTWLVYLRQGVKFHNGKEMTAEDVALNFDWKINAKKYYEKDGRKPPRTRSTVMALKSVEAIDRYTLKFNLREPFGPFVNVMLAWGLQFGPIDPEVVEKYGRATAKHPIGTGPFRSVKHVSGSHMILKRFDDYWGQKPYLDKVIIRIIPDSQTRAIALEKGEIDIAASLDLKSVPRLKRNPNINIFSIASATKTYGVLWFNFRRWPMNQAKFRKAIGMGVDWRSVTKAAFPKGTATPWHTILKGSFAENPEAANWFPVYNPQLAKQLLKEVMEEAGKPIQPIYFLARRGGGGIDSVVAQIAASQMRENIGLNVNLHILEYEVAKDKMKRDPKSEWDLGLTSVKGSGTDPMQGTKDFYSKNPAAFDFTNRQGYKNPRVDDLFEEGVNTTDPEERTRIYRELEKIVLKDDLVCLILYNTPIVYGINKRVHDFKSHESAFLYINSSWNNMWIEK